MNALHNANTVPTPGSGLTSFAFPVLTATKSGKSVRYEHNPRREWYVFRVTYRQEVPCADLLIEHDIYAYLAMGYKPYFKDGKKKLKKAPMFNLIFAYVTKDEAEQCVTLYSNEGRLTYYYNHFDVEGGKNPPLRVKEHELKNFMHLTMIDNAHVMNVNSERCKFVSDEIVRVIYGPFEGVEGRVIRVSRQQRVAVTLSGINSVIVTAYIPSAWLKRIEA